MIDIDALPPSIGVGSAMRYAGVPTPPRLLAHGVCKVDDRQTGWVRNQMPECPLSLGLWICVVCQRLSWDLRALMCPFGVW
jgi:hypothetical protein